MEVLHTGREGDTKVLDDLVDDSRVKDSVSADVLLPHLHEHDVESPASHPVQPGPAEGLQLILTMEVKVIVVIVLMEDV